MTRKSMYIALAVIFAASLSAVVVFHFFPARVLGELAGVPAVAVLFGALFQLFRDHILFERSFRLEEAKNQFTMGAMSHMAAVAFDKHVRFCEEYAEAGYRVTANLLRKGPHAEAMSDANMLCDIRIKWTLWLSPELSERLGQFEKLVRDVGMNKLMVDELEGGDDRSGAIAETFRAFAEVMGLPAWKGEPTTQEHTVEKVVELLRAVLGIEELTRVRTELVNRASQSLK